MKRGLKCLMKTEARFQVVQVTNGQSNKNMFGGVSELVIRRSLLRLLQRSTRIFPSIPESQSKKILVFVSDTNMTALPSLVSSSFVLVFINVMLETFSIAFSVNGKCQAKVYVEQPFKRKGQVINERIFMLL